MAASRKAIPTGSGLDLKDPDLFVAEDYHSVFARLRAAEPVYWNPEADSTGFWAVTRYQDIRHGSSFVAAVQFTGGKCPVKADTFVTYSQSQDETSRHVNDFTKAYSRKDWSRAAVCPAQVRRSAVKTVRVRSSK